MTISDLISKQAKVRPDAPAVWTASRSSTYGELEQQVEQITTYFMHQGVERSDTVAVSFSNEDLILIVYLALARIGATVFPVPVHYPSLQKEELYSAAACNFLILDQPIEEPLKRRLSSLVLIYFDSSVFDDCTTTSFPQIQGNEKSSTDTAFLIAGSGTTGKSKLMPVSHEQILRNADRLRGIYEITQADRIGSHVHLNFLSCIRRALAVLMAGGSFVVIPKSQWKNIQLLRKLGVTYLNSTVFHIETMGTSKNNSLDFLRVLNLGGSVVTDELRRRIISNLTPNLHITYGANECGDITMLPPELLFTPQNNVGLVLPDTRLEIVSRDDDILPNGQVGIVRVQTPATISGYLGDEKNTKTFFRGGWFYPGDLGLLTNQNTLVYYGRADQLMIMNGINIYPSEIESVIGSHPNICDAVAFPIHHKIAYQIPFCAVVLEQDATSNEKDLLQFAREHLGPKAPRRIIVLQNIPRNDRGKVIRKDLFAMVKSHLSQARKIHD